MQLEKSRVMPSDLGMTFAWEGMRKGFRRFIAGAINEKEASKFMQKIADREMQKYQMQKATQ